MTHAALFFQEWRSELVQSQGFSSPHPNPTHFPFTSQVHRAPVVHLSSRDGPRLSSALIEQLTEWRSLPVAELTPSAAAAGFTLHLGKFYRSANPAAPVVGDLRVTFEVAGLSGGERAASEVVSVVAEQSSEGELVPHLTRVGYVLRLLCPARLPPAPVAGALWPCCVLAVSAREASLTSRRWKTH